MSKTIQPGARINLKIHGGEVFAVEILSVEHDGAKFRNVRRGVESEASLAWLRARATDDPSTP